MIGLFPDVYEYAHELGIAIDILTNGSRLANRRILDLLTTRPANLVTVSVYGASAESYDGLTRRPGSYKTFMKGLQAAHEAGVRLALALIIVARKAHEADDMKALAARLGVPTKTYSAHHAHDLRRRRDSPSAVPRVPRPDDGPQALPRLPRRTDCLPRQPARHGERMQHMQGRP